MARPALIVSRYFPKKRMRAAETSGANRMIQGTVRGAHQNFRLFRSSTWIVCLARKSATMIARPTATSAAATVITKNTSTCPL